MSTRRTRSLTSLPALTEVEGLYLVAVDVRTRMFNLSRFDDLDATETLRSYIRVILGM